MPWMMRAGESVLRRKPEAPTWIARVRVLSSPSAVKHTAFALMGGDVTRRVTSMPSRRGMWMSTSTTSGRSSAAMVTASAPSVAIPMSVMSGVRDR